MRLLQQAAAAAASWQTTAIFIAWCAESALTLQTAEASAVSFTSEFKTLLHESGSVRIDFVTAAAAPYDVSSSCHARHTTPHHT